MLEEGNAVKVGRNEHIRYATNDTFTWVAVWLVVRLVHSLLYKPEVRGFDTR
jgi:hypothetical protein